MAMHGEEIVLEYLTGEFTTDAFNKKIPETDTVTIDNVLIQPLLGEDLLESNRPDGLIAKYKLYIPKTYMYPLSDKKNKLFFNAKVHFRDEEYYVIGTPDGFDEVNCPTEWCMAFNVGNEYG